MTDHENELSEVKERPQQEVSILIVKRMVVTAAELEFRRTASKIATSERYRSQQCAWINDVKGAIEVARLANRHLTREHIETLQAAFDKDVKSRDVCFTCGEDAATARIYSVVSSVPDVEPEIRDELFIDEDEIGEMHADASHARTPHAQFMSSSWFMDLLTFFDYHDCHASEKGLLDIQRRLDKLDKGTMYCEIRDGKPICTFFETYEFHDD